MSLSSNSDPPDLNQVAMDSESEDLDNISTFEWSLRDYLSNVSDCSGNIIGRKYLQIICTSLEIGTHDAISMIHIFLAPDLFQIILGKFQNGNIATMRDYQAVLDEISNLKFRIPIYQRKVKETLYHEAALIKVHSCMKTTYACLISVLENLMNISSDAYLDCMIHELCRITRLFRFYIDDLVTDMSARYNPTLFPMEKLEELFPELLQPVLQFFPTLGAHSNRQNLVRVYQDEILFRGGLIANRDFYSKLHHLRKLRSKLVNLDNEDVGSSAFRVTLHQRIASVIRKSEIVIKHAKKAKFHDANFDNQVFHDDFIFMTRQLRQATAYRIYEH